MISVRLVLVRSLATRAGSAGWSLVPVFCIGNHHRRMQLHPPCLACKTVVIEGRDALAVMGKRPVQRVWKLQAPDGCLQSMFDSVRRFKIESWAVEKMAEHVGGLVRRHRVGTGQHPIKFQNYRDEYSARSLRFESANGVCALLWIVSGVVANQHIGVDRPHGAFSVSAMQMLRGLLRADPQKIALDRPHG